MYTLCTLYVYSMYTLCILYVYSMYTLTLALAFDVLVYTYVYIPTLTEPSGLYRHKTYNIYVAYAEALSLICPKIFSFKSLSIKFGVR
jgi:hypothetical protein